MATDARALNAIALQATLNGSLIVPTRALARQLSRHRLLEFSIPLKGSITGQADLFVLTVAQPGSLQGHFAPPEDHVAPGETWLIWSYLQLQGYADWSYLHLSAVAGFASWRPILVSRAVGINQAYRRPNAGKHWGF